MKDRKLTVHRTAARILLNRRIPQEYASFLRSLFSVGDWFVTITFRDRFQDSGTRFAKPSESNGKSTNPSSKLPPDPRIAAWEPDSRNRREPGPPVRDAALREIGHWLFELGWEAAGRSRQEIFARLADGMQDRERRNFAKRVCRGCLYCEVMKNPVVYAISFEIERVATSAIGWVIAEEFGRAGGRWHVHLLIRGATHLRRKRWWKKAFDRFGRSRIEPIYG